MKCIFLLSISLVIPFLLKAQSKGSFIDSRDGKSYVSVTYNLSFPDSIISDLDEYKSYATQTEASYEIKLAEDMPSTITWMAENLNFEIEDSKCYKDSDENCALYGRLYTWSDATKVCPQGWHLPTDKEWYILANQYGGVSSAGEHLKSEQLGGTNKSLFDVKKAAIFWSSDEMDAENAWDWKVNFRWTKLQRWKGGKSFYNSVRCVKDY